MQTLGNLQMEICEEISLSYFFFQTNADVTILDEIQG